MIADEPHRKASTEELLVHLPWARRLAHGLIVDGTSGDDVLQEAYAAVMVHPPLADRPTAPWFATVIRNAAHQLRRSERRRERWETEAHAAERETQGDQAESPAELVARAQIHRMLVEAVLELDEPYRSTVLLRYFEEREPSEIARAQGIPAGTVRWRLKEGIDRLRARLDQRHDGDRRRWALVLAPFAADRPRPLPYLPLLAAGAGATALVVLIGVAAGLGPCAPRSNVLPTHVTVRPLERKAAGATALVATPQATPEAPPDDGIDRQPGTGEKLIVHVQDVGGGLIADAGVRTNNDVKHGLGRTGADGTIVYERRPSLPLAGDLLVEAPGYADARARYAFPGEVTVKMVPQSVVSGVVIDGRTGTPVPGLTVSARGRRVVSGADGSFTLDRLPAGAYPLEASGSGWYGRLNEPLSLGLGRGVSGLRIKVARAFDIVGLVHAGSALPPAGTKVQIDNSRRETVVDGQGRFSFAGVSPGVVHIDIRRTSSGTFFTSGEAIVVEVTDHDLDLDLDLGPRHDVTVEVVDEDGHAVPGYHPGCRVTIGRAQVSSSCTTNAAGRCVFAAVPTGIVEISDAQGHVAKASVPTSAPVRLVTKRPGTIRGRLVTADGRAASPRLVRGGDGSGRSDLQGRFTFSVPAGTVELEVWPDRMLEQGNGRGSVIGPMDEVEQRVSVTVGRGEQKDVTIQLPVENAKLEGRVLEADGSAAEDTLVTLHPAEASREGWARFDPGLDMVTTDGDGRFAFSRLVSGRPYQLIAFRSSGEQAVIPGATPGTPVTLRLMRLASLEVKVSGKLDRTRSVGVLVLGPDGTQLAWGWEHDDARTLFRFFDLPTGTATVRLENGWDHDPVPPKSTEASVTLEPGRNDVALSMP